MQLESSHPRYLRVAILTGLLLAVAAYWLVTVVYLLPPNPLRNYFSASLEDFGNIASQRWSFFAPPPQSNKRLYYAFFDAKGAQRASFEVLEPIHLAKRQRAPFNTGEEILDYILCGAEDQIGRYVSRQQTAQKAAPTGKSPLMAVTVPADKDFPPLHTLKAYAQYIVQRNNIPSDAKYVTITCTSVPIPPLDPKAPVDRTEKLVFRTTMFQLAGG